MAVAETDRSALAQAADRSTLELDVRDRATRSWPNFLRPLHLSGCLDRRELALATHRGLSKLGIKSPDSGLPYPNAAEGVLPCEGLTAHSPLTTRSSSIARGVGNAPGIAGRNWQAPPGRPYLARLLPTRSAASACTGGPAGHAEALAPIKSSKARTRDGTIRPLGMTAAIGMAAGRMAGSNSTS